MPSIFSRLLQQTYEQPQRPASAETSTLPKLLRIPAPSRHLPNSVTITTVTKFLHL
jgi:hypothetical protein